MVAWVFSFIVLGFFRVFPHWIRCHKYNISSFFYSVIQQVISSIRCNDLLTPVKRLATERYKLKHRGVDRTHSIYRDILFLASTAIGRTNIDLAQLNREYASVFDKLTELECNKLYRSQDLPPSPAAICCRAYFKPLMLPWHEQLKREDFKFEKFNKNIVRR